MRSAVHRLAYGLLATWRSRDLMRLRESPLFDPHYYAASNPDIGNTGLDPASHYLLIGGVQLRDPSADVDAFRVLSQYPFFKPGKDNPVLYLERAYRDRGRPLPALSPSKPLALGALVEQLSEGEAVKTVDAPDVDIIVPVYNNRAGIELLLESLLAHTPTRHTVILIDDKSTDPGIAPLLQHFAETRPNTRFIGNAENLGYAASINQGLANSERHKILLNSDTVVPEGWVDRLLQPIVTNPDVAAATPYSNASTYSGFPNNWIELGLPGMEAVDKIAHALARFPAQELEMPSGVGFCMAVNAQVVDEIGGLDDATFRQGYYEDTDWCCRAREAGYKVVLANRLFVGHGHLSASFGLERKLRALIKSELGMRQKHPGYFDDMSAYFLEDPHAPLRRQSYLIASAARAARRIALFCGSNLDDSAGRVRSIQTDAAPEPVMVIEATLEAGAPRLTARYPDGGEECLSGTYEELFDLFDLIDVDTIVLTPNARTDLPADLEDRLQTFERSPRRKVIAQAEGDPPAAEHSPQKPSCIAVVAASGHRDQPPEVDVFVEHVSSAGVSDRIVIFGETQNPPVGHGQICSTGAYRLENLPALMHHYGVSAAYFPRLEDKKLVIALRLTSQLGIPVFSHGTGGLTHPAPEGPNWSVLPPCSVQDVYDRIRDALP